MNGTWIEKLTGSYSRESNRVSHVAYWRMDGDRWKTLLISFWQQWKATDTHVPIPLDPFHWSILTANRTAHTRKSCLAGTFFSVSMVYWKEEGQRTWEWMRGDEMLPIESFLVKQVPRFAEIGYFLRLSLVVVSGCCSTKQWIDA